ncbi:MAG TPA: PTS sugar transporter subunit IIA [Thermoanaerobaculia bacterium]|nr:PTS sugar transporter subunit IIA [Thermoanaerobaculia bacterium]
MTEDRLMTIKQLAEYLMVNDRTVLKLVTEGALPGVKVGNQWRFRKAMIDTWLDDQMLGVTPRYLESPKPAGSPRRMLELSSCFQPDHVIPELASTSPNTVIEELAGLAGRLGLIRDPTWFVGALIQRENVMPSAMGGGIAFLHTLRRNPEQVVRPFMVLGRSTPGVDFDALDGQPTHLFFALGLKFEELYLPWLHKLSQMFARPDAVQAILDAPDAASIFEAVARAERRIEPELKVVRHG